MQRLLFDGAPEQSSESLEDIYGEILEKAEVLFPERIFIFGDGNPNARLVLIGESPSHPDDVEGRPFSGPAGELLMRMIGSVGLSRDECYFTNTVKFISQGDEITSKVIEFFTPYLVREIRAIGPELIVSMGNTPTRALLNTKKPISQLRGEIYDAAGFPLIPIFNSAYLLRDPTKKREAWDDMKRIRDFLN